MKQKLKTLRILLFILFLWDLILGILTIFLASHIQIFLRLTPQEEPIFIRGVGLFWLYVSFIYLLGFLNPKKNLVCIHLTILFRILGALIDIAGVILLPKPFYFFHYILILFAIGNMLIIFLTVYLLKKNNLPWFFKINKYYED